MSVTGETPKVSVITVAYNVAAEIAQTIESVLAQTYIAVEHIVIDGGSSDGTPEIIAQYSQKLAFWVSEPDGGIYDAMNKGVRHATGDFVVFMNAGDWFKTPTVIADVMALTPPEAEMIYGNHEVVYPQLTKIRLARPSSELWKGMAFNHQTLFAKRELLVAHPFDLQYKVIADFHFIFNRWKDGSVFFNTKLTHACFRSGGVSEVYSLRTKKQVWQLVRQRQPSWRVDWFHAKLMATERAVLLSRKWLPEPLFFRLMALKNKLLSAA